MKPITAEEFLERGQARSKTAAKNLRDLAHFLEQHPEMICNRVKMDTEQDLELLSFSAEFLIYRP